MTIKFYISYIKLYMKEVKIWKFLSYPSNFLKEKQQNGSNFLLVAAYGGLLYSNNNKNGEFFICNFVTFLVFKLPLLNNLDILYEIAIILSQKSHLTLIIS